MEPGTSGRRGNADMLLRSGAGLRFPERSDPCGAGGDQSAVFRRPSPEMDVQNRPGSVDQADDAAGGGRHGGGNHQQRGIHDRRGEHQADDARGRKDQSQMGL